MPTSFTTNMANGDVIQTTQVTQFASPINNLETGSSFYAADSGSANAYAASLSPAPSSYTAGMIVHMKVLSANTGASTINVNGLGTKSIKKNASQDLGPGDLAAGQLVALVYDGTNFQLLGSITNHAVSGALYVAAAGSSGAFTGNTTPSYTAYTTGDIIVMKANHSPSGSTTLNLNSLGAKNIKRTFSDGTKFATVAGDILSGRLCWLLYDGTDFLIMNADGRVGWSLQDTVMDIASSSNFYADFNQTTKDTHDFHPGDYNTEVKIPTGLAGTYVLTASIVYAPMAEGSSFYLRIYKNGSLIDSNYHDGVGDAGTGSSYYSLTYAITHTLAAGDVLKLYAWQDSGSTLNGCYCSFEGSRICD